MKRKAVILFFFFAVTFAASGSRAAINILNLRQGATGKPYCIWVKDYDANNVLQPCDLTGTTITCSMRNLRTGANVFTNRAVVVYDATQGKIKYCWQVGDTVAIGDFAIQFKIIDTDGSIIIIPAGEDAQIKIGVAY